MKKFNKIIFLFFYINNYLNAIYLQSGIKSLNKFLYHSRISKYSEQNNDKICSLSDGPNCFFTEKEYIKYYISTKNENNLHDKINNGWVKLYSKIPKNEYGTILQKLEFNTSNYINTYSNQIDEEQNPKNDIANLLLTFDSFDIDTIKGDKYLDEKTDKIIYNEYIIAEIKGKLLLKYDKDDSEKDIKNKRLDYPKTTYGVIESDFITITFKGKLFSVNFLYIKGHDKLSKYEPINFYGYLNDQMVYSYTYTDNQKRKEKWLKVAFPETIIVDKLLISGTYDIDNISFNFPNSINVDTNEIYSMYNYKNIKILVKNEDI
jgi:hypothetical protein